MTTHRRIFVVAAFVVVYCQIWAVQAQSVASADSAASGVVTLFQNVRVFNGKTDSLSAPSYVLVRGNKIDDISTSPIATDRRADTKVIDGGGRTLMPGLIDMHWHATLVR